MSQVGTRWAGAIVGILVSFQSHRSDSPLQRTQESGRRHHVGSPLLFVRVQIRVHFTYLSFFFLFLSYLPFPGGWMLDLVFDGSFFLTLRAPILSFPSSSTSFRTINKRLISWKLCIWVVTQKRRPPARLSGGFGFFSGRECRWRAWTKPSVAPEQRRIASSFFSWLF